MKVDTSCLVKHKYKKNMETKISLIKSKEHYRNIQQVLIPFEKDIKEALSKIKLKKGRTKLSYCNKMKYI